MKLKPVAMGASLGIVWGSALFLTTWLCFFTGYGRAFLEAMPISLYPAYSITPWGSVLGLIYGFLDLFIMGFISGWIYNRLVEAG